MEAEARRKLGETLEGVRARLAQLGERSERIGEQDTKAVLIEPVLAALGWQLHDLGDVRREYRRKPQDNPVDYALLIYGKPRLFVEAKALGSTLDRKSASQVLGYASVVGVSWCLLTNGDEYRLYNSAAAVDVEEKLFRSLRLSDADDGARCLETLELIAKEHMGDTELDVLWRSQFVDRRVEAVIEELFGSGDAGLVRLIRRNLSELTPGEIRDSLNRARLQLAFPVVHATPTMPDPTPKPAATPDAPHSSSATNVELRRLVDAGLVAAPLRLERRYKGVDLEATIEVDGRVRFGERVFHTPSGAGGAAKRSVIGPPDGPLVATNGWTFWRYRTADGELQTLDELRRRFPQS